MFEFTAGEGVDVHDDGVALQVPWPAAGGNGAAAGQGQGEITGRMLIDCMGNFSPIVRQVRKSCLRQLLCGYRTACTALLVVDATLVIDPDDKLWMYLVYLKFWALNRRPLMVYPKLLSVRTLSSKAIDAAPWCVCKTVRKLDNIGLC